jgi:hypothetical protein
MTALYVFMAGATMAAAGYVQHRLSVYVAVPAHAVIARICLVAVGIAVGLLSATTQPEAVFKVLGFLAGFGVVHVPAAFVLFFKRLRGSGKS